MAYKPQSIALRMEGHNHTNILGYIKIMDSLPILMEIKALVKPIKLKERKRKKLHVSVVECS